jgi:hypothetical protein
MDIEPKYLSIADTAGHLAISPWSVKMLLRAGQLRAVKSGTRTLVEFASVKEHAASLPKAEFLPPSSKRKRRGFACHDCGVDVLAIGDWYMATADVWERRLGLGWNDNLCIACLERRLGRAVRPWDDVKPIPVGVDGEPGLNHVAPARLSPRMMELFPPPKKRSRRGKPICGGRADNGGNGSCCSARRSWQDD